METETETQTSKDELLFTLPEEQSFITMKEAGRILNLSRHYTFKIIIENEIDVYSIKGHRLLLVMKEDVLRLKEALK